MTRRQAQQASAFLPSVSAGASEPAEAEPLFLAPKKDHHAGDAWSLLFPPTIDLSAPGAMDWFMERPVVVLSPHFDDACFSLGTFLAAVGKGSLINVFTQGAYLADRRAAARLNQKDIFQIRDSEDCAFAERCGFKRYDLGCEEPVLIGRRIHDLRMLDQDLGSTTRPIVKTLSTIAAAFRDGEEGLLLSPMGLGGHVNHRAVAEVVLRNWWVIRRRYQVLFYEDLPYGSHLHHRLGGLCRLWRRSGPAHPVRHVFRHSWPEKEALLRLYPTQMRGAPQRERFRPSAAWPFAPHEAFWWFDVKGALSVVE